MFVDEAIAHGAVLLNGAAALVVADAVADLKEGVEEAGAG